MSQQNEPRALPASVQSIPPIPSSLESANPLRWLGFFGPGAVIASLTIGTGELIFSTRAGALFGYRILSVFCVVLFLKWVLVWLTGRHMILSGAHPFQRWMELPGPHGWLPLTFLVLGAIAFPIWVAFHAATLGTLFTGMTGTGSLLLGAGHLAWAIFILAATIVLVSAGGYGRLERLQLIIVCLMLLCVVISLIALHPDWIAMIEGLMPRPLSYPIWVKRYPEIASRSVVLEVATYVGVIGGSGFDYLAYVTYLRDKRWGRAGRELATPSELTRAASDPSSPERKWLRALCVDSVLSFATVLLFSAVFVACGSIILGPKEQVPSGSDLLNLQTQFMPAGLRWMRGIYYLGAFLTLFGTLYGTIEVAPAILREITSALRGRLNSSDENQRCRRWAIGWVSMGGMVVLFLNIAWHIRHGGNAPGLIAFLTPANLFTGVLACGFICGLALWSDWRHLPRGLRAPVVFTIASMLAAILFIALGLRAYWDHAGVWAYLILLGSIGVGLLLAALVNRVKMPGNREAILRRDH